MPTVVALVGSALPNAQEISLARIVRVVELRHFTKLDVVYDGKRLVVPKTSLCHRDSTSGAKK